MIKVWDCFNPRPLGYLFSDSCLRWGTPPAPRPVLSVKLLKHSWSKNGIRLPRTWTFRIYCEILSECHWWRHKLGQGLDFYYLSSLASPGKVAVSSWYEADEMAWIVSGILLSTMLSLSWRCVKSRPHCFKCLSVLTSGSLMTLQVRSKSKCLAICHTWFCCELNSYKWK